MATPNTLASGQRGYQFQSSSFHTNDASGPGIYFRFDIDAIRVVYEQEVLTTFGRFLTNLCAIVGGIVSSVQFLFYS